MPSIESSYVSRRGFTEPDSWLFNNEDIQVAPNVGFTLKSCVICK